ncbi:Alpha/Beta hydrolase protein [Kockovaella imperatae]|uniref:Alpha/Beta hydrolase protein n=1 Tax=Kockovaella imperatae TaxID=4999 RepID=A0A1Y1UR06_9TREE|nr:Alpha/Beta hydrolase protein [Kockovaella imperatae]ORX39914.1 Alpha/Beta hydrolase protein [Kockovaella imperatae]
MSPLWDVVEPYLKGAGLYQPTDLTYGRWNIGHHPPVKDLLNDPKLKHSYRRVFIADEVPVRALDSEIVDLGPETLRSSENWLSYSIWEMPEPDQDGWEEEGRGRGKDLVLIHGLSDYGLRYAPHIRHFLRAGFRVVIPDLPSYGRSTGVHSYIPAPRILSSALHCVLTDLVRHDITEGLEQRKVFLSGSSLGGWTVLYYLSQYPPTTSTAKAASNDETRIQIAGAYVLCPMVSVSAESRPWKVTEYIGRCLRYVAGPLPLAKSLRGKVSDDPRVEEDFFADPLCYHGYVRVATAFMLLDAMAELDASAEKINAPIRLVHGSSDRVTSPSGTLRLFERLPHQDKQVEIFEGYEHIMLKVGIDEQDDAKRQRVLNDWRRWLIDRC